MADYNRTQHDPRLGKLIAQARAACDRSKELRRRAEEVMASNRAARQLVAETRLRWPQFGTRRHLQRQSEFLRLVAQVETMPVIEQAKGVIMAQSRCAEAEAFDLLRRASQRSNIRVRELALEIVRRAGEVVGEPVAPRNGQIGPRPKTEMARLPRAG